MKKSLHFVLIAVGLCMIIPFAANAQTINTIAGTGTAGYIGDNGQATAAELHQPTGLGIDASGNIYFADFGNNVIRKIDVSTGIITTVVGNGTGGFSGDGGQATAAELMNPEDVKLDASGNMYIADYLNFRVRMVNHSTGVITTIAGNGTNGYSGDNIQATTAELDYPTGVGIDSLGNVYICDFDNERIRKVATSGIITTIAGTGSAAYSGDGGQATAAEIYRPAQMAFDKAGNIYFADYGNNRIREINMKTGIIATLAGDGTASYSGDGGQASSAELNNPFDVGVDKVGNIYIPDLLNNRIRMITISNGVINTIAGNGIAGYSGDGGPAAAAEMYNPVSLINDAAGDIYFSDRQNAVVRKIGSLVGINEVSSNTSIVLYPNPNNGSFTMNIEGIENLSRIEVYNTLGQIVYSTNIKSGLNKFNLGGAQSGVYVYRVLANDKGVVKTGKLAIVY